VEKAIVKLGAGRILPKLEIKIHNVNKDEGLRGQLIFTGYLSSKIKFILQQFRCDETGHDEQVAYHSLFSSRWEAGHC